MTKFRVSLEFDLDIGDDAQARALAADSMQRRVRAVEADGRQPETWRGESPEVTLHAVAQDMEATAVMLALEVLRRGARTVPWLRITEVDVRNAPTVR
ncbi:MULTISPECIES: hypothetical protein [unclassified Geodermatophilus]|uniref:hypothetical protein n=1 Tax=unclassified Geodermatophilus TaxID=2637632 RepID=UPI003EEF847B